MIRRPYDISSSAGKVNAPEDFPPSYRFPRLNGCSRRKRGRDTNRGKDIGNLELRQTPPEKLGENTSTSENSQTGEARLEVALARVGMCRDQHNLTKKFRTQADDGQNGRGGGRDLQI